MPFTQGRSQKMPKHSAELADQEVNEWEGESCAVSEEKHLNELEREREVNNFCHDDMQDDYVRRKLNSHARLQGYTGYDII